MTQPSKPPEYEFEWSESPAASHRSPSNIPVDFSPPLIAMVVVVGTAFLLVTYFRLISRHILPPILRLFRRWQRRRRRPPFSPSSDIESPPPNPVYETAFNFLSPYGLDESVIKTIPLSVYTKTKRRSLSRDGGRDCAVCLLEFEEKDYVRTLPVCSHAFHVDCIDIWLRSHANCPLCRAGILRPESPFVPLMAARIRPSLDDGILSYLHFDQRSEPPASEVPPAPEITIAEDSPLRNLTDDRINGHDFLLKRSYSFSFERSLTSDRMVLEPATTSPWRYRRGNLWRRTSPFSSSSKPRVFSFRYYRGMKSPFMRRRSFFPLSESSVRYGGGGGSSRRTKSMTSPIFLRPAAAAFSSSRLRCGDPEALLSPERLNRR